MTKLYAGLDVSLERTSVCVVDEDGRICLEARVPSEPNALIETLSALDGAFEELERECAQALRDGAVGFEGLGFQRAADMRYVGQEHTVTVPVPDEPGAAAWARARVTASKTSRSCVA